VREGLHGIGGAHVEKFGPASKARIAEFWNLQEAPASRLSPPPGLNENEFKRIENSKYHL
jgi:hypothetical protein